MFFRTKSLPISKLSIPIMFVLLYRLELYDLLIFWLLTFTLILLLSRVFVISLISSLVAIGVYFGVYAYFAVPPVHADRYLGYISTLKAGAHRGLALDAPENTMAAFRLSKQMRADSLEFDLEFTKDGVAVILHDDTVDRTTDGTGRIDQMTWDQVQQLNAAAKFVGGSGSGSSSRKVAFERVPTFEETLQLGMELGLKMFIDVKTSHPMVIPTIMKMYKKYPILYNTTSVCSFYPQVVYYLKRADPGIITGHTWHSVFITYLDSGRKQRRHANWLVHFMVDIFEDLYLWSLHNWMYKWTGINLVLAHHEEVTKEYIEMWHKRKVQVIGWTVNDIHEKRHYLYDLKCPFLTDRLSDLQSDLK